VRKKHLKEKNRLWKLAVAIACASALILTGFLALPRTASAVTCSPTVWGFRRHTNASFYQQASMVFCSDGRVKVGVWVYPLPGYNGSHIINCTAHLWLEDTDIGPSTRTDRPQRCDLKKAKSDRNFTVGPSVWYPQNLTHFFIGTALVNIQTNLRTYNTGSKSSDTCACDPYASSHRVCDFC
jgi:hypothetical protein